MESANHVFLKTIKQQNAELEQLRKQQRQFKLDLRTANSKADEMTRCAECLRGQMVKKEEEVMAALEREAASDKRLKQLQSSMKQLNTRLCLITKESEQLKIEKASLVKQIQELQKSCADLTEHKYDSMEQVRNTLQLFEDAKLQESEARLTQQEREKEVESMKEALSQLLQNAASRTRKEVENERKRFNIQISRLTQELSALQLECGEKQSQIDRANREKRAVEEELEKMHREDRENEGSYRKIEELHQRCLIAERTKDDVQLSLQLAQNKMKQQEMNYEETIECCQEKIKSLQSILDSERQNFGSISEECLKLQQENEQFKKETEVLKRKALEAQQTAKLKISTMENEHFIKEHAFEVQLKEMEDLSQNSIAELRRLLIAQQKATNRWKEETKKLVEITEARINNLKSELNHQKSHNRELLCQLERASAKVTENEKFMLEHQEKVSRLQSRLNHAEERAAMATQQLSALTMQKKKTASLLDLENV